MVLAGQLVGIRVNRELISRASRNEFRELLVGFFVLREIDMMFESAGITAREDYNPQLSGQRRTRVEQYYANIDFNRISDVRKVVAAFEEIILQLRQHPHFRTDPETREQQISRLLMRMQRDGFHYEDGKFASDYLHANSLEIPSLVALTEESITEHIEKARAKIEAGDSAGAITNAYTLVEQFLKEILRQTGTEFKETEGDIKVLYNCVCDPLNLNPKGEHLESHLRGILQGLKSMVAGLYEVANKASDRHARKYNPAPHHAKLAVNAALTLCEFLLDSFAYQDEKRKREVQG